MMRAGFRVFVLLSGTGCRIEAFHISKSFFDY